MMENISNLDTANLTLEELARLYYQVIPGKDYDWWYEIQEGDTVVDIGAGIGLFSRKALEAGAGKVLMIEPNKRLLRAAIKNCSDYIIDRPPEQIKLKAINAAIGKDIDRAYIYKSETMIEEPEARVMSFAEICYWNQLEFIQYLRIDAWGAEYNILNEENFNFIKDRVKFVAVRIYLDKRYNNRKIFEKWRETFLSKIKGRLLFKDEALREKIFLDDWEQHIPSNFMLYIKNW